MALNFRTLKRKSLISAIVKSVVLGASAGLLAAGIVILVLTLAGSGIHWAFYILIGVVCALVAGGAAFVFLRPNDKRVAKKYDKEFALNEKLQTMVEFKGQEGDIISLQREDANEKLGSVVKPKLTFRRILKLVTQSGVWQCIVAGVLALAIFFSGVGVKLASSADNSGINGGGTDEPPEEPPYEEPDPDLFEYDLYMQAALWGLIDDVTESTLADDLKNAVKDSLYSLDESLAGVTSRATLTRLASATITEVDGIINSANSFIAVSEAVKEFDENLYAAILNGALVYRASPVPLNSLDNVKSFKNRISDNIGIVSEVPLREARLALKVMQQPNTLEEDDLYTVLNAYIDGLSAALEKLKGAAQSYADGEEQVKSDLLYDSLATFLDKLKSVPVSPRDSFMLNWNDTAVWGEDADGNANNSLPNSLRKIFETLSDDLITALSEQCYNCAMDTFVRLRLSEIFGIPVDELPKFNEDIKEADVSGGGDPGDPGGDPEDPSHSGGIGDGKENYGADDKVYDIDSVGDDSDGYVKFGDVLDRYQAIIYGKLDEYQNEDVEITDEMFKAIQEYLDKLYSGSKDKTDDN